MFCSPLRISRTSQITSSSHERYLLPAQESIRVAVESKERHFDRNFGMFEFLNKSKFLLSAHIITIVAIYAAQLLTIQQRCRLIRIIGDNNLKFSRVCGQMASKTF